MATYTINTTDEQEALVSWIVAEYNHEHDTTFTNTEYIMLRFGSLLEPFAVRYRAAIAEALKQRFAAADATVQQQVKALLGIT